MEVFRYRNWLLFKKNATTGPQATQILQTTRAYNRCRVAARQASPPPLSMAQVAALSAIAVCRPNHHPEPTASLAARHHNLAAVVGQAATVHNFYSFFYKIYIFLYLKKNYFLKFCLIVVLLGFGFYFIFSV